MSTSGLSIPTIDFTPFLRGSERDRRDVANAIGEACEVYGFLSLVGHGLPPAAIEGAFQAAQEFFDRPDAEKRRIHDQQNNRGYIPMFDSVYPGQRPNGHEAFSMGHPVIPADPELAALPFHAPTPFPELSGFREKLEACYNALYGLSQSFLRATALHLGTTEDFFDRASRDTYSNMRVVHYPPMEAVATTADVGVHAHFDESLITLLIQDMNGGLSVRGPDDSWLPVIPNREAVVVNVGKLLRRWTNGRYNAALHKVVNSSGRERYSIPLFVHPAFRTIIDPRDLVGADPQGDDYTPIVAGERVYANFMQRRPSWRPAGAAPPSVPAEVEST